MLFLVGQGFVEMPKAAGRAPQVGWTIPGERT